MPGPFLPSLGPSATPVLGPLVVLPPLPLLPALTLLLPPLSRLLPVMPGVRGTLPGSLPRACLTLLAAPRPGMMRGRSSLVSSSNELTSWSPWGT